MSVAVPMPMSANAASTWNRLLVLTCLAIARAVTMRKPTAKAIQALRDWVVTRAKMAVDNAIRASCLFIKRPPVR